MLLIPAIILVLLFALLINSCFQLPNKVAYLLGVFVTAWASVILVLQVLSLLRWITAYNFLWMQSVLVIAAYLVWVKREKPSLWRPLERIQIAAIKTYIVQHPLLAVLGLAIAVVYVAGAFLILYVPPNNFDGMVYHLSRVGYWLQHQSTLPWQTPNPRQVMSPMNAELGILWTVLFWGTDQLAGYVQWTSALVAIWVVFGLSRLAGATRSQSSFAALLFAALPQILLQSTTVQNDLVVTAFFAAGTYFLIYALLRGQRAALLYSGIALGLSLGAKATAALMLPGMVIGLMIAWAILGRRSISLWTRWIGCCIVGFVLFGLLWMVQNYSFYGNPLGVSELAAPLVSTQVSRLSRLPENLLFYTNQFLDFSGLPYSWNVVLSDLKLKVFLHIFEFTKINVGDLARSNLPVSWALKLPNSVNEDTSWFGPVSFLFVFPAAAWQFPQSIRKKNWVKLVLVILGIGFLFVFSLFTAWTPYKGRYFILPAVFLAPLAGWLYGNKAKISRILVILAAGLTIWVMAFVTLVNGNKPLIGQNAVWGRDRLRLQTISNSSMRPVFEMVEKDVPMDAVLATRLGGDHWDYPLFGKEFKRKIFQTSYTDTQLNLEELREAKAQYLLVAPNQRTFIRLPAGLDFIEQVNGWILLRVMPVDAAPAIDPVAAEQLSGLVDPKKLVFIGPALEGQVGLIYTSTIYWGVEEYEGHGIYWLGEGGAQGINFYIWAEQPQIVSITFDLTPGPGREDPQRRMMFLHYFDEPSRLYSRRITTEEFKLSAETSITFQADLLTGMNELSINCLDSATVWRQPNGDERPLMVLLNRVDINPQP